MPSIIDVLFAGWVFGIFQYSTNQRFQLHANTILAKCVRFFHPLIRSLAIDVSESLNISKAVSGMDFCGFFSLLLDYIFAHHNLHRHFIRCILKNTRIHT